MNLPNFLKSICAVISLFLMVGAYAQQAVITTNPIQPLPNQPFQVSITAVMQGWPGPPGNQLIEIQGGIINVYLRDYMCVFVCQPPILTTESFTVPALPPGKYVMNIFMDRLSFGVGVQQYGQLAFDVAPVSVPALSNLGLMILSAILVLFAGFIRRVR
ncbi:MAG: IPTL-CTERM sorting domain-containing protein [Pseudomonadota bacterium]